MVIEQEATIQVLNYLIIKKDFLKTFLVTPGTLNDTLVFNVHTS